jgi:transketolase
MNTVSIEELKLKAKEVRRHVIRMLTKAGSGHSGGSLSAVEIITTLYYAVMNHRPKEPTWPDRDRFVLSKGHGVPALYAVLAMQGYFPVEELAKLRKIDGMLQGHPDMVMTPGIEMSTGSLGQGLSTACGMALGGKINKKNYRVYALLGDGEVQEGQIWEAAMCASHYRLDNLCAFIDYNGFQIDGPVNDVMQIEPLVDKWKAFGWHTLEIDGHSIEEILNSTSLASKIKGKPTMIISHTIKGKGVSFMEGENRYHGVAPTKDEERRALLDLQ